MTHETNNDRFTNRQNDFQKTSRLAEACDPSASSTGQNRQAFNMPSSVPMPNSHPTRPCRLVPLLIVCLLTGLSASNVANAEQLRLEPAAGSVFHLVYLQTTQQTTTVAGKALEMNVEMGMEMDWTIASVSEAGELSVEMRFTRFSISMESEDVEPIIFDSDDLDAARGYYAESMRDTLVPFLQDDILVKVSPQAEILSVEIPIALMDALREAPGSMQMRDLLTQEGLAETLSGTLCRLPAEEVDVDETWVVEAEKALSNGTLQQEHTYKFAGTEDQRLRIEVRTELDFQQPDDDIREPQEIRYHNLEGKIWLSQETGFFAGSEFLSELITETPYRDAMIETVAEGSYKLEVTVKK